MEQSPLMSLVTPRMAKVLGFEEAQQKQSHEQMSHKPVKTIDTGFTKEDFNLTGGIMQQPLKQTVQTAASQINQGQMQEEGINMVSDFLQTTPAGGMAGIIGKADASIFDKMHTVVTKKITRMQEFLEKNPDRWQDTFVHDPTTGRNYFQDMRGQLLVEYPDVIGKEVIGDNTFYGEIKHPDPDAQGWLTGVEVKRDKSTYYRAGKDNGFFKDSGTIGIEPKNKGGLYFSESKAIQENRTKREDTLALMDSSPVGTPEWSSAIDTHNSLLDDANKLSYRITGLSNRRRELHNAFNASYLAHEATHAMQYHTGLPMGGNPKNEADKIFKSTIGSDPDKLTEYNNAVNIAQDYIAQDPMTMMISIASGLKGGPAMMKKYGEMTADPKFFKESIRKVKNGNDVVETIPDKKAILSEVMKDIYSGYLKVEGTPIESWFRLSDDAFKQYNRLYGEAYARVSQHRAFKAASGKDPDIYKKNPQRDFDVPVEDITYPKEIETLDDLPKGYTYKVEKDDVVLYDKDGNVIQGISYGKYYTLKEAKEELLKEARDIFKNNLKTSLRMEGKK